MKLFSKPISSPGRAEKYPPPLMRFLRSNAGSRSRGKSRSSPMFIRKKNAAVETQEPSSPKVTCMGQVRVRRSKQRKTRPGNPPKRRCKWIRNTLCCHRATLKFRPRCFRPGWRKWLLFFHVGFTRKSKIRVDSSRSEAKFANRSEDLEPEEEEEDQSQEVEAKVFDSVPLTPPKNALLLTRCRSAPYRSSSLASRFWGSPLGGDETEQKQSTEQKDPTEEDDEDSTSKRDPVSRESDGDPESEEKIEFFKDFEGSITSIRERMMKPAKIEELRAEVDGTIRPLILTRCKSEPARIAEKKLDPEMSFWKKRRLGFT